MKSQPKPVNAVARATRILEFLAQGGANGSSLATIARSLDLNKTTVYNTLATLRTVGWVEQDGETGNYRLGDGVAPLARHHAYWDSVSETLHPVLDTVSAQYNELAHLGRLTGRQITYLDKVEPDRPIRVVSKIGAHAPAVRTALGRALIASSERARENVEWYVELAEGLGLSDQELVDLRSSVDSNIQNYLARGWTSEVGENEEGISCVAVPLRIDDGRAIAISVTAPSERLSRSRMEEIATGIGQAVQNLPSSSGVTLARG